jgi:hypothetical protein
VSSPDGEKCEMEPDQREMKHSTDPAKCDGISEPGRLWPCKKDLSGLLKTSTVITSNARSWDLLSKSVVGSSSVVREFVGRWSFEGAVGESTISSDCGSRAKGL